MSIDEVVSCMRAGKFKPNCGLGTSCFSVQVVVVTHLLAHKFYWIFWCAMVT